MILCFKHLLKHNMVKTQASPPQGGEAKQTGITPTEIPSYWNSQQSCFKIRLYHTGEKLMFLFSCYGNRQLMVSIERRSISSDEFTRNGSVTPRGVSGVSGSSPYTDA